LKGSRISEKPEKNFHITNGEGKGKIADAQKKETKLWEGKNNRNVMV